MDGYMDEEGGEGSKCEESQPLKQNKEKTGRN